jgi:hypothetical protein
MNIVNTVIVLTISGVILLFVVVQARDRPATLESTSAPVILSDEEAIRSVIVEYVELSNKSNFEDLKKLTAYPPTAYWEAQSHVPVTVMSNKPSKRIPANSSRREPPAVKPWTYYDTFDYRNMTEFLPRVIVGKFKAAQIYEISAKGDLGNAMVEFVSIRVPTYNFYQKFSLSLIDNQWKIYHVDEVWPHVEK